MIIDDDICRNNDGDDFDDKDLGWDTLEIMRRIQFRLTLMYRLTHGLIDIDSRKYLIQHSESHTRASHQFKFCVICK